MFKLSAVRLASVNASATIVVRASVLVLGLLGEGCCFGGAMAWPPPSGSYACDESATRGICRIYQASAAQTLESAQASCAGTVDVEGCPSDDLRGACEDSMGPDEFFYGNFVNYAGSALDVGAQQSECRADGNTWLPAEAAAGRAALEH